jgi:hypothetical protein
MVAHGMTATTLTCDVNFWWLAGAFLLGLWIGGACAFLAAALFHASAAADDEPVKAGQKSK